MSFSRELKVSHGAAHLVLVIRAITLLEGLECNSVSGGHPELVHYSGTKCGASFFPPPSRLHQNQPSTPQGEVWVSSSLLSLLCWQK